METFKDDFNEITWYKDDLGYEADKIVEELNSWHSDNINEYVCETSKLGNAFRMISEDKGNVDQFFGFADGKFVSTILLSKEDIDRYDRLFFELKQNITNNKLKKDLIDGKTPLSNKVSRHVLRDMSCNQIYYLVVNPNEQNKGYGTRVVGSIKNNKGFFLPCREQLKLGTMIHHTNNPSMSVFEKNGFKRLNVRQDDYLNFFLEDLEK